MSEADIEKTNWSQSVGGVCIRDGKVLLARHTYGAGKGMFIIPGGYVNFGEIPEEIPQDNIVNKFVNWFRPKGSN